MQAIIRPKPLVLALGLAGLFSLSDIALAQADSAPQMAQGIQIADLAPGRDVYVAAISPARAGASTKASAA